MENDVQKNTLIGFFAGVLLGAVGAGLVAHYRAGGDADYLIGEYRASEQRSAETVSGLTDTIERLRGRIAELEQSNSQIRASYSRLEANNRDAGRILDEAIGGSETAGTDIRSAIALSKKITDALKDSNRILNRGRSGGDSGDGLDNVENL
jgi:phage shock protein A